MPVLVFITYLVCPPYYSILQVMFEEYLKRNIEYMIRQNGRHLGLVAMMVAPIESHPIMYLCCIVTSFVD